MQRITNETKQKYYPVKIENSKALTNRNNNYPVNDTNNSINPASKLFRGIIVNNMRFGGKEYTLSGFVRREILMKDNKGNKQIAREEQFFNSGKNINVRIKKLDKSFGRLIIYEKGGIK